jgi:hypothetical protein
MHFNPTIYLASIESKQVPAMPCKKALTQRRPNFGKVGTYRIPPKARM